MQTISFFILIAGFIIGLGAVTVIDLHGFLGRKSWYWTEATIRTHKITKPLIWIGTALCVIGGYFFYKDAVFTGWLMFHLYSLPVMILNGIFLSFVVSPFLLDRESQGQSRELLPKSLQTKITISFILSFLSWWGNVFILAWYVANHFVR